VTVLDISDDRTLHVRELQQAQRALRRGAFLHTAGDAYGGRSGLVLPFGGRTRRFATGFASLALLTGVPAIPVFATIEVDGRIRVEILAPLSPEPDDGRPEDRVASLVRSYARLLEARWSKAPGNVLLMQLRQYALLSRVSERAMAPPNDPGL
jgi:KDO2-lipid IV(A) lauroyltransferase